MLRSDCRVKVEEILEESEAWVHYIDFGNRLAFSSKVVALVWIKILKNTNIFVGSGSK